MQLVLGDQSVGNVVLELEAGDRRQALLDVADIGEQLLRRRWKPVPKRPSRSAFAVRSENQAFHATMNLYGRRETVFRRSPR